MDSRNLDHINYSYTDSERAKRNALKKRRRKQLLIQRCVFFLIALLFLILLGKTVFSIKEKLFPKITSSEGNNTSANKAKKKIEFTPIPSDTASLPSDVVTNLNNMAASDKRVAEIVNHYDQYPADLLELLSKNTEATDFVLNYPSEKDKPCADTIGDVTKGVIPHLLQWDTRWGYGIYGDNFLAINGCGPTSLAMVVSGLTECPFQYYVYKQSQKSYRDLPCRYGETSTLFRNEDSGEMHGLTRVRQFTISEGHLVIRPDQVEDEFKGCVDLAKYCLTTLGVEEDVTYRLSLADPDNMDKYLGTREMWDEVEDVMRKMLDHLEINYTEETGEAAFYGPKLDIQAKNVYGKEDTMITIQLDMFLAERFDMTFVDKDGEKKRPYIIHRTAMGCYERTLAWLIEKYAGLFPTWLCPEQVRVLPISEKYHDYANKVANELRGNGVKCTVDERAEKIGYKIRETRLDRVPYMLVVGAKEEEEGVVSVRSRYLGDEGQKPLDTFINDICKEIRTKEIRKIEVQEDQK